MKKLLPIVLVVALIVIGGGAYLFMNQGKTTTPSDTGTPASESAKSDTFMGTLKEAVALGVGMKCTYKVEGNEYEGYVKGENYKGTIKTAEGKEGGVIMKDNCMWTWTEGESQGVKFCYEDVDVETEEETDVWEQSQGTAGSDMTYSCVPFAVTDAQFTPPAGVNFLDMESMMEGFGVQE